MRRDPLIVLGIAAVASAATAAACKPGARDFPCSDSGGCPPGLFCGPSGVCQDMRPPLRPLAPLSSTIATSRQPLFRWQPDSGSSGVTIDICADRDCRRPLGSFAATGSAGAPPDPLPAGVVFWQIRGTSVVWQLTIPALGVNPRGSAGVVPDFDGDGFADLAVGVTSANGAGSVVLFRGGPAGVETTAAQTLMAGGPGEAPLPVVAGDINGDGFVDLAVGAPTPDRRGAVSVYLGGPTGLAVAAPTALDPGMVTLGFGQTVAPAGDVNGDGYADLLVGGQETAQLYLGGAAGITPAAGTTLAGADVSPDAPRAADARLVAGGEDFNGDGFPDAVVGAPPGGSAAAYLGDGTTLVLQPGVGPDVGGRAAGDANCDGFADFVGQVLFTGGPEGLDRQVNLFAIAGESFHAAAGDVNGDGFADLAAGSSTAGKVYVFYGGAAGPPSTPSLTLLATPGFGSSIAGL